MTEKSVSKLEGRPVQIIQFGQQWEEDFFKNEKSLKVPESLSLEFHKERRKSVIKAKIMTENFQNMMNDINLWIQTSQQVPKRVNQEIHACMYHNETVENLGIHSTTYMCMCVFHYCCSVVQLCPTLCDPMHCSMPGFPVLHHLPVLAQTHVHWVGNAIQGSHPLSSPSPPAPNLSQDQGLSWLFSSGGQSVGVPASASVLPMNI